MPTVLRSPCSTPGCPRTVQGGGPCDQHRRERERSPERRAQKALYASPAWRALRWLVLARDPICRICGREPSRHADHVVPRSQGGSDDASNLQGVGERCHSRKTAMERARTPDGRWV